MALPHTLRPRTPLETALIGALRRAELALAMRDLNEAERLECLCEMRRIMRIAGVLYPLIEGTADATRPGILG